MSRPGPAAIGFLTLEASAPQRGRTPQFAFMRSRIRSAVVFGSIVAGLRSGTGGGLTVAHSVVMSFACEGSAANPALTAARAAAQPDSPEICFIMFLPIFLD